MVPRGPALLLSAAHGRAWINDSIGPAKPGLRAPIRFVLSDWRHALVESGRAEATLLDGDPKPEDLGAPPPRAGEPVQPFLDAVGARLTQRPGAPFRLIVGASARLDWLDGPFGRQFGDLIAVTLLPAFSGLALVRPDGVVSFRARELHMEPLRRHLQRRLRLLPNRT